MEANETTLAASLAPFRIEPEFVERVWGFEDLRPWYAKEAGDNPIGEVWLTGDKCRAATGPLTGQTLEDIFGAHAGQMLGSAAAEAASPLLIKVIFAREKLSVQVHPDDAMAERYGFQRGKTECWYALAAEPGATVACGLKLGVTAEAVRAAIESHTLEELLQMLPVAKGSMVYVDAGTVHAIWPGSILLETQQNCDLTYRLYDYGRPRELHIDKSLEALRTGTSAGLVEPRGSDRGTLLIDSGYFRVERVAVEGSIASEQLRAADRVARLSYLFAAEGSARIAGEGFESVELPARGIVAVPALAPAFTVEDRGGLELICISDRRTAQPQ